MKTDHTFTFTAAVILAGVALALINPAGASDNVPASLSAAPSIILSVP